MSWGVFEPTPPLAYIVRLQHDTHQAHMSLQTGMQCSR